jgi:hypothetical protein
VKRLLPKLVLVLGLAAACVRAAPADVPLSPLPPPPTTPAPSVSPILQMPNVVGMAYSDAADALRSRGFTFRRDNRYTDSEPSGQVLKQSKRVGAVVPADAVVTLTVAIAFPPPVNGNPWGYNWACCKKILDPPSDFCSFFDCVLTFYNGTSYVVQCQDGTFSATGGSRHTCSGHDGHKRTLLSP